MKGCHTKGPNYPFLEEFTVAVHNVFNCKGHDYPHRPYITRNCPCPAHKNKLALPTEQGMAGEASSPLPSMHRPQTHSRSLSTKNQNTRRNQQHRRQQPRRASQTHQRGSSIPSSMISGCCVYCVKILPPPFLGLTPSPN